MADYDQQEQDQTYETDPNVFKINALRDSAFVEEENRRYKDLGFNVKTKPEGYIIDGDPVPIRDEPRFDRNNKVFYSGRRPDGYGEISADEYNPEIISLFFRAEQEPNNVAIVTALQEQLFKIGYLDHVEDIDGLYGPMTKGAAHRYRLNKPGIAERVINWLGDVF